MRTLDDGAVIAAGAAQRPAPDQDRTLAAALEHRRDPAALQRAHRRHVARRTASARAVARPRIRARISLYARRHNVKPGITGWAQIHGLRGETDTDEKMRKRVEYDLYYIDNWSLWLDFKIMVRTVLSRAPTATRI